MSTTLDLTVPAKAKLTDAGLDLPDGLDFDAWAEIGERLGKGTSGLSWAIGDWVSYGFWTYGKRHEEGIAATGLSYQTLANLKWVSERIERSRRRENSKRLRWSHFAEVAALDKIDQELMLDRAEREKLSQKALREAVAATKQLGSGRSFPIRFSLTLPPTEQERAERWRHAAEESELEFGEWAARALDQAAEVIDG